MVAIFTNLEELRIHIQNDHMNTQHAEPCEPFPCETCGLVLATFSTLQEHITNLHTSKQETCKYCQHTSSSKEKLREHTLKEHEDVVIYHTLAIQVDEISEKLVDHDSFKGEVLSLLRSLVDKQDKMNKEIISLKNNQVKPEMSQTPSKSSPKMARPPSGQLSSAPKTKFNKKQKILYVADSVGHTVSARDIEKANDCRIVTDKAYSSVHDVNARWPKQNFSDAVKTKLANPGRDNIDILVMSAPTVDITNLDTSQLTPSQDTQIFQEKSKQSSKNMFNLAERSLAQNPSLEKVIIMEHPPRFDTKYQDPMSLKPKLAKLANATLGELWFNSQHKHKIFIGQHSLESSGMGASHLDRYREQNTGKYDGVHLYGKEGRTDYANSVNTIMMLALEGRNNININAESGTAQCDDHSNCPQSQYQRRLQAKYQRRYQPSISTSNRFSVLNSNLGNF